MTVEKGQVIDYSLKFDEYVVNYDEETKDPIVTKDGELKQSPVTYYGEKPIEVYFNPGENGGKCTKEEYESNSDKLGNSGCMKWYAYSEDASGVNMILDHNTTSKILWAETDHTTGPNQAFLQRLYDDTKNWSALTDRKDYYSVENLYNAQNQLVNYKIDYTSYKARIISMEEIAYITDAVNGINWSLSNTNGGTDWYYLDGKGSTDSNWQTMTSTSTGASVYAWLFDNTSNCTNSGCNVDNANTNGYWTSSPRLYVNSNAWGVDSRGLVGYTWAAVYSDSIGYGIRPVITVPKTIISN